MHDRVSKRITAIMRASYVSALKKSLDQIKGPGLTEVAVDAPGGNQDPLPQLWYEVLGFVELKPRQEVPGLLFLAKLVVASLAGFTKRSHF